MRAGGILVASLHQRGLQTYEQLVDFKLLTEDGWRGWLGSNQRPLASEANTLSTELQPRCEVCEGYSLSSVSSREAMGILENCVSINHLDL
jgi:hypothetical protein